MCGEYKAHLTQYRRSKIHSYMFSYPPIDVCPKAEVISVFGVTKSHGQLPLERLPNAYSSLFEPPAPLSMALPSLPFLRIALVSTRPLKPLTTLFDPLPHFRTHFRTTLVAPSIGRTWLNQYARIDSISPCPCRSWLIQVFHGNFEGSIFRAACGEATVWCVCVFRAGFSRTVVSLRLDRPTAIQALIRT